MQIDWTVPIAMCVGFALGFLIWGLQPPARRTVPKGYVLMPLEPTDDMLRDACHEHEPGKPMSTDAGPMGAQECPRFIARRAVYRRLLRHSPNWRAE